MRNLFILFFILFYALSISAQPTAQLDGYIYEAGNRGYLNQVKVRVYELPDNIVKDELTTDNDGHFVSALEEGKTYRLLCVKDIFHDWDTTFVAQNGKNFFKVEMNRKPGYLFDVTLAEPRMNDENEVGSVQDATIEIYNRTQKKSELVLKDHPTPYFQFTFEQGNYYTIMIRKVGYLTKRIEAHVNIDGCIICIDGVNNLRPGVTENLTEKNTMGTLLANIEIEPVKVNKKIGIQNIYYDLNKWAIKPEAAKELDKVVLLMKDNPVSVELGSHTDARGSDEANMELSQKRAESAVAYIVNHGIDPSRITAKGFGETELFNRCANGVKCSENEHALNRRTELRITGVNLDSLSALRWHSLEQIIREEEFDKMLLELDNPTQIKIGADGKPVKDRIQQGTEAPVEIKIEEEIAPKASSSTKKVLFEETFDEEEKANPNAVLDLAKEAAVEHMFEEGGVEQSEEVEEEVVGEVMLEEPAPSKINFLPADFTGHNVFIASSQNLLADNTPLFNAFTQVYVRQNMNTKHFEYYVGNFQTKMKAENYLNSVVYPVFPTAQLARFENGAPVE